MLRDQLASSNNAGDSYAEDLHEAHRELDCVKSNLKQKEEELRAEQEVTIYLLYSHSKYF